MGSKKDSFGVLDLLTHVHEYGVTESYPMLETRFSITPYSESGHRARKLINRWKSSKLSPIEYVRKIAPKSTLETETTVTKGDERTWEETGSTGVFKGTTTTSLRSEDEAIAFSKVDLDVWEKDKYTFRSWDVTMKIKTTQLVEGKEVATHHVKTVTNYGIVLSFKRKVNILDLFVDDSSAKLYDDILNQVLTAIKVVRPKTMKRTSGVGVVSMTDFHMGADVKDLILTPDFDMDIVVETLRRAADKINSYKYAEVHVNMLGDYFESISGLNHLNTFKSLGKNGYGAKIMIIAGVVLSDFLQSINNLHSVNMVAGNHDRVTMSNTVDNEGAAAEMLAHVLELRMPTVSIDYHPYCLPKTIDGIRYILTHGHFSMNKKSQSDIILKYGDNEIYNLWLEGHLHTRKTVKVWTKKALYLEENLVVSIDEANYRKITVPSIFTGNFFSETLGYTTAGGYIITQNDGNGKLEVFDLST